MSQDLFKTASKIVHEGGIIAYPTEGVFGLGCDPFNETAVKKILTLKQRDPSKGLILIASDWEQINNLITELPPERLNAIKKTWPGPYTWIFPASSGVPKWIRGDHPTIALRLTCHPIAKKLCNVCQMPLVSTSANRSQSQPAKNIDSLKQHFGDKIDLVIPGPLGSLNRPTVIRDGLTGQLLRGKDDEH